MQIKTSKPDIIWNYIGTIFQMGINYLLLPFLLYYFDEDTLGLWYIYMNLATFAALFEFGFSPAIARNMAYCWSGAQTLEKFSYSKESTVNREINHKLFGTVLTTCRVIYLMISLISLFLCTVVGTIYVNRVAGQLMYNRLNRFSWMIIILAIFSNIYFGYYLSVLNGVGHVAERNKAQVLASISRIILTGILLFLGSGLLGACVAYLAYGIVLRYSCRLFFRRVVKEKNIEYYKANKNEIAHCLKTIWPNSWRDGIVSFADYLCTQAGTIVMSLFFPLSQIAAYSLSTQLVVAIGKISRSFQVAKIPSLQSAYINKDKELSKRINSQCVTVFKLIYFVGVCGLFLIAIPFVHFFRPQMELNRQLIAFICISQYIIVQKNIYGSYLSTTNRVEYWKSFIISGVLTIVLSIILISKSSIGLYGVPLASIISESIYNGWYWRKKVKMELSIGRLEELVIGSREMINGIKDINSFK